MASDINRAFVVDFRRCWTDWEAKRRSEPIARAFEAYARGLYDTLGWIAHELERKKGGGG
jgi:hypothetical protein